MAQMAQPTITERDTAVYVGMSRAYLRIARQRGYGPAYLRLGRAIRYRVTDLDSWLEQHRVEPRAAGR